ncbi:hypothetical protein Tco_0742006 [Tanacetum coccineum]
MMILENKLESLKLLENKLESMKILENKLESLKLQENQPGDELVPLSIKKITSESVFERLIKNSDSDTVASPSPRAENEPRGQNELSRKQKMSADSQRVRRDGGGDDVPLNNQLPHRLWGCLSSNRGKGTRKPNLGGRRAGRPHTRQETRNLGLKAITDKSGPVPIRELPLHYPSWRQMSPERKAGVVAKIGTQFDLRPHMESDRWPQIYAGIQQHLQKIYNGKKAALKERYWVPEEDGTYDLERLRRGRPSHISEVNWDAQLAFWNDPKNLARAAQNKQNRAKSKVMETSLLEIPVADPTLLLDTYCWSVFFEPRGQSLYATGSRIQHLHGVTDTEDRSWPLFRGGQASGAHSRSDDKFSQMLNQFESQPEYGGGSGSGGCS